MRKDDGVSIGSTAGFFYSIAVGVIVSVLFFRFQKDALDIAVSNFRLVVALGGCVGLLARWISDASKNQLISKGAAFLMNIACSTIGVVFTMLYYIARG
ncbi:hypothetical protein AB3464_00595 [Pseudomonas asplenii]|uniref:hypothetical protein n=1 Tax=Pseudomonas asplenii TaxID=53407 RepID=UPI0037C922EB